MGLPRRITGRGLRGAAVLALATLALAACFQPHPVGYGGYGGYGGYATPSQTAVYHPGGGAFVQATPLAWSRVRIVQSGASWDLPGMAQVEYRATDTHDASVLWDTSVDVGGMTFGVSAHDFIADEIRHPEAAADGIMAVVRERFGVAPANVHAFSAAQTRGVDASFQAASGARAVVRVVVARTRAYLIVAAGPGPALDAHAPDIARFFQSFRLDDESERLWEPGTGVLTPGRWYSARPTGAGFVVDLPGVPRQVEQETVMPGTKATTYTVVAPGGGPRFAIVRWYFDSGLRPPRDTIERMEHHVCDAFHATITGRAPALVDNTGARRLTLDLGAGVTGRTLLVTTETDAYELTAVLPSGANAGAVGDAERFLGTFHLTE